MKSFLLKNKSPIIKWGLLPNNVFFEGKVPEEFNLAICPGECIVLDIDRHGNTNGFNNIPIFLVEELANTYNYETKNNGKHCWFKYTGNKDLGNKSSKLGIDLRVANKGYVVYYPANQGADIRNHLNEIKETSKELNIWLEKLFS